MEWRDEAIVLSLKTHGETSVLVELFTAERGRHLGLVRGGKSRKIRPILQVGNIVNATWRARLDEHLGAVTVEMIEPIASRLFDEPLALAALSNLCSLLSLFPERDPHRGLYKGAKTVLTHMEEETIWPSLLVRFEMEILSELGYQLDVSECAATGSKEDLIFVSPKSGKAVSKEAGEPYKDKLLELPAFLRGARQDKGSDEVSKRDILNGFALTGFFLERFIFKPETGQAYTQGNKNLSPKNSDHYRAEKAETSRNNFLKRLKKSLAR